MNQQVFKIISGQIAGSCGRSSNIMQIGFSFDDSNGRIYLRMIHGDHGFKWTDWNMKFNEIQFIFIKSVIFYRQHSLMQQERQNLKFGRRCNTNSLTLSRTDLKWSHWRLSQYLMFKYVKCFNFIIKSQISFTGGKNCFVHLVKDNRRKFVHLSSFVRATFTEGPSNQCRSASFKFL